MGRDVLIVNIPIFSSGERPKQFNQVLRLCTTHLESLPEVEGKEQRPLQLAQISALMKVPPTTCAEVATGLIGGNINPILPTNAASHKAENTKLCDACKETPPPPVPPPKPFQEDLTCGRAREGKEKNEGRGSVKEGKRVAIATTAQDSTRKRIGIVTKV